MSQPAAAALASLPFELVLEDGQPLETEWHSLELPYLRDLIHQAMVDQGRTDFYVGGNMFVYYSVQQAWDVAEEMEKDLEWKAFRGPDVFWVGGVDPERRRKAWISWEEGGRLPDVIVELLSPATAKKDRTEKRDLYARVFRTAEYFLFDPETQELEGLRLAGWAYRPIQPDEKGRLWSEQLGVSLGLWKGAVKGIPGDWLRLFRSDGSLVPTEAEAQCQRADAEHQRLRRNVSELKRRRPRTPACALSSKSAAGADFSRETTGHRPWRTPHRPGMRRMLCFCGAS